jgi:hypothetical protein
VLLNSQGVVRPQDVDDALLQFIADMPQLSARIEFTDHLTRCDVERGEQVGRAVARVSPRSALGLAEDRRQDRLRALQRLNLRLLVEAQNRGVVRRIVIYSATTSRTFSTKNSSVVLARNSFSI